jgi:hypothetical protein
MCACGCWDISTRHENRWLIQERVGLGTFERIPGSFPDSPAKVDSTDLELTCQRLDDAFGDSAAETFA